MGLHHHLFRHLGLGNLIVGLGIGCLAACLGKIGHTVVSGHDLRLGILARLHIAATRIAVCVIVDDSLLAHNVAQTLLSGERQKIGAIVSGDDILAILRV